MTNLYKVTECDVPNLAVRVQLDHPQYWTELSLDMNTSGVFRYDLITLDGNKLNVIQGTPGGVVPAAPVDAQILASVEVFPYVSTIRDYNITDLRGIYDMSVTGSTNEYGFTWGSATVERLAEIDEYVCIRVKTTAGKEIEVYSSPQGRSLRVFKGGKELK